MAGADQVPSVLHSALPSKDQLSGASPSHRDGMTSADDRVLLRAAAHLGLACKPSDTAYSVGCIIAVPEGCKADFHVADSDVLQSALKAAIDGCDDGPDKSAESHLARSAKHFASRIIGWGFSRQFPGNTHAEECALHMFSTKSAAIPATAIPAGTDHLRSLPSNATVYTTMEPCGERLSGKLPCADRLIACKAGRVVVGVREPPKFISACTGTVQLQDSKCEVAYLEDSETISLAKKANQHHDAKSK